MRCNEYMQPTSLMKSNYGLLGKLILFLLFWELGGLGFFGSTSCFSFVIFGVIFGLHYWEVCIFHQ